MNEQDDRAGYGIRDGQLVFIGDVSRGLACNCICARCSRRLIAKKGAKRRPHFAHHERTECRGAPESVLHRLSKELLAQMDAITIPPYEFTRRRTTKTGRIIHHEITVAKGGHVRVDRVIVEASQEGFVPDIIIESDSKRLIVEVAVSSKVTRVKLRRMRKRDLPAIEIRLDAGDSLLPREELRAKLQSDLGCKIWLFHPAQREAERAFLSKWRDANSRDRIRSSIPHPGSVTRAGRRKRSTSVFPSQPPLSEYDRTFEEFRATHGRYPNEDECLEKWPHLWRPKS